MIDHGQRFIGKSTPLGLAALAAFDAAGEQIAFAAIDHPLGEVMLRVFEHGLLAGETDEQKARLALAWRKRDERDLSRAGLADLHELVSYGLAALHRPADTQQGAPAGAVHISPEPGSPPTLSQQPDIHARSWTDEDGPASATVKSRMERFIGSIILGPRSTVPNFTLPQPLEE